MSKIAAVRLIQTHGLETQPSFIFDTPIEADRVVATMPSESLFVLRTSANFETLNLPRIVGATPAEARRWLADIPGDLGIILQPFDPVLSSAELCFTSNEFIAEIIPGIWELDNTTAPVTISGPFHQESEWVRHFPQKIQRARFVAPETFAASVRVNSATTLAYERWIRDKTIVLQSFLRDARRNSLGLKLQQSIRFGISAQNTRNIQAIPPQQTSSPSHTAAIPVVAPDSLASAVGHVQVRLTMSFSREESASVLDAARQLFAIGVRIVYIRSGLLSHMAILLREAGLETRRDFG